MGAIFVPWQLFLGRLTARTGARFRLESMKRMKAMLHTKIT